MSPELEPTANIVRAKYIDYLAIFFTERKDTMTPNERAHTYGVLVHTLLTHKIGIFQQTKQRASVTEAMEGLDEETRDLFEELAATTNWQDFIHHRSAVALAEELDAYFEPSSVSAELSNAECS